MAAAAAAVGSGDDECAQGDRGPARGDGTAAQLQRHQLHRFALALFLLCFWREMVQMFMQNGLSE